jgi:hypothetical protein
MTKKTIKIRGNYLGKDLPYLKKGAPMCLYLSKDFLIESYRNDQFNRHINNVEGISFISYVKQRVHRIFLTNSVYL